MSIREGTDEKCLYSQLGRNCGSRSVLDPLVIRNITAGTGHDNFTLPNLTSTGEHGTVQDGLRIPICGNKVHILADGDATIVYRKGSAAPPKVVLHSEIPRIRE